MSLEPTSVAYSSSYLGHALLFLSLTCFPRTLSCSWCNRSLRDCLYLYMGGQTTAGLVWPIIHNGLTGSTWAMWFNLEIWASLNFVAFFLASKACDGSQWSSLPFWESCLALNLGGAYESIVTHIGALKAFDMLQILLHLLLFLVMWRFVFLLRGGSSDGCSQLKLVHYVITIILSWLP
jgi:hypothetical protein